MRTPGSTLTLVLATTLCLAQVVGAPGPGIAAQSPAAVMSASSYAIDAYDASGAGDDTPELAHTVSLGDYGSDGTESHTLDLVNGPSGDNDWVKFAVTSHDIDVDKTAYLLRTQSTMHDVDTVIEVYGPSATPTFPYRFGNLSGSGDIMAGAVNDQDMWRGQDTKDSALLFRPADAGTYWVRIRPNAAGADYVGEAGSYTLHAKRGVLYRVQGADRIKTAIKVSEQMYEGAGAPSVRDICVVVANAYDFPDALAGSLLCGIGDGVLLLTPAEALPDEVGTEIERIGANRVYVVGGPSVVSDNVVTQLGQLAGHPSVHRVYGGDRWQTAAEIARQARDDAEHYEEDVSGLAIVAYGMDFPDALGAAAFSAARNVPVLLTDSATLHPAAAQALTDLSITDVVIVGGAGVVSSNVESQLEARLGADHVYRTAGDDRYETAKDFATWASDLKGPGARDSATVGTPGSPTRVPRLDPTRFGIASGEAFPDGLSGGAACGLVLGPLLLTRKANPYGYITAEFDGSLPAGGTDWVSEFDRVYPVTPFADCCLFGGTSAVTQSTMAVLDNSLMLVNAP